MLTCLFSLLLEIELISILLYAILFLVCNEMTKLHCRWPDCLKHLDLFTFLAKCQKSFLFSIFFIAQIPWHNLKQAFLTFIVMAAVCLVSLYVQLIIVLKSHAQMATTSYKSPHFYHILISFQSDWTARLPTIFHLFFLKKVFVPFANICPR
jgi:hypothetical protein